MKKRGDTFGYIGILLLLHFLPRFEKEPEITDDILKIVGRNPIKLSDFLIRNKEKFEV
jgi:hypothetical protein